MVRWHLTGSFRWATLAWQTLCRCDSSLQFSQLLSGSGLRSTYMCVVVDQWCCGRIIWQRTLRVRPAATLMLMSSVHCVSQKHLLTLSTHTHTQHTLPTHDQKCMLAVTQTQWLPFPHTHTHTLRSIPSGKVKRGVLICSSQLCVTSLTGTRPQYKEIKQQRWPCVS